jgi:hypothetical protein
MNDQSIQDWLSAAAAVDDPLFRCHDCGINAWAFKDSDGRFVTEEFYVHDDLWDAACPDDVATRTADGVHTDDGLVLCVGCFERRLGRELARPDFQGSDRWSPREEMWSLRLKDRWARPSGPV